MNILELKEIAREEGKIFYLRKFTAIAVLELPTETCDVTIDFTIETNPFGNKSVTVKIKNSPNYPVMPLINALKTYVLEYDTKGLLPQ